MAWHIYPPQHWFADRCWNIATYTTHSAHPLGSFLLQLPLEGRQVEATLAKLLPVRSSPGHFSGVAQHMLCLPAPGPGPGLLSAFFLRTPRQTRTLLALEGWAELGINAKTSKKCAQFKVWVSVQVCVCVVCGVWCVWVSVCGECACYPSISSRDMPSFRQTNTTQTDREGGKKIDWGKCCENYAEPAQGCPGAECAGSGLAHLYFGFIYK